MQTGKGSLWKNSIALYVMNIAKIIFPLLTLPYLTRVLTTDTYGVVTYAKTLNSYVQLFLDFGFLLSATKSIVLCKGDKEKIGAITGDTFAEKCLLGLFASLLYVIALLFVPIMNGYFVYGIMSLLSVLVTVCLFDFLFRGIEKMHLIAIPFIISKAISTVFTFVLIHNDQNILLIPLLDLISNLVASAISLGFVFKLGFKFKFSGIRVWLHDIKASLVYFVSNFATTVFGALTTLISGIYLTKTDVAYWGLCMQFLSAAKAMYNPISNSIYPYMVKERDIKLVRKIGWFMLAPMICGCAIVMLGGEWLVEFVGGSQYSMAGNILKLLLPAFVFSFYSMLYGWPVLGVIGKEKETTATTVIAAVVQVAGLAIIGISALFSLTWLAVITSVSEVILFATRYFIYCKTKKEGYYISTKQ